MMRKARVSKRKYSAKPSSGINSTARRLSRHPAKPSSGNKNTARRLSNKSVIANIKAQLQRKGPREEQYLTYSKINNKPPKKLKPSKSKPHGHLTRNIKGRVAKKISKNITEITFKHSKNKHVSHKIDLNKSLKSQIRKSKSNKPRSFYITISGKKSKNSKKDYHINSLMVGYDDLMENYPQYIESLVNRYGLTITNLYITESIRIK